jgi:hypothetical protein
MKMLDRKLVRIAKLKNYQMYPSTKRFEEIFTISQKMSKIILYW